MGQQQLELVPFFLPACALSPVKCGRGVPWRCPRPWGAPAHPRLDTWEDRTGLGLLSGAPCWNLGWCGGRVSPRGCRDPRCSPGRAHSAVPESQVSALWGLIPSNQGLLQGALSSTIGRPVGTSSLLFPERPQICSTGEGKTQIWKEKEVRIPESELEGS